MKRALRARTQKKKRSGRCLQSFGGGGEDCRQNCSTRQWVPILILVEFDWLNFSMGILITVYNFIIVQGKMVIKSDLIIVWVY